MIASRPSDFTWARNSSGESNGLGVDIVSGNEDVAYLVSAC